MDKTYAPPHAHFVRAGGGKRVMRRQLVPVVPPHAHFVRAGGGYAETQGQPAFDCRLTLTSFAPAAAARYHQVYAERANRLTLTSFAPAAARRPDG